MLYQTTIHQHWYLEEHSFFIQIELALEYVSDYILQIDQLTTGLSFTDCFYVLVNDWLFEWSIYLYVFQMALFELNPICFDLLNFCYNFIPEHQIKWHLIVSPIVEMTGHCYKSAFIALTIPISLSFHQFENKTVIKLSIGLSNFE